MLTHTSQVADYGVYMWIIYHVNLLGSKSLKFLFVPKSQLHWLLSTYSILLKSIDICPMIQQRIHCRRATTYGSMKQRCKTFIIPAANKKKSSVCIHNYDTRSFRESKFLFPKFMISVFRGKEE